VQIVFKVWVWHVVVNLINKIESYPAIENKHDTLRKVDGEVNPRCAAQVYIPLVVVNEIVYYGINDQHRVNPDWNDWNDFKDPEPNFAVCKQAARPVAVDVANSNLNESLKHVGNVSDNLTQFLEDEEVVNEYQKLKCEHKTEGDDFEPLPTLLR